MGNTNCGKCLTRESEMIAEILLGKNEERKEVTRETSGAIKNISEELHLEKVANKFVNDLKVDNNNAYHSKYQNDKNQYNITKKYNESKQMNHSNQIIKNRINNQNIYNKNNTNKLNLLNEGELVDISNPNLKEENSKDNNFNNNFSNSVGFDCY